LLKVTLSQKGQISLPASLRKQLGLKKGDKLIAEEHDGRIILYPIPEHPLLSLKGKYYKKDSEKLTTLLLNERNADRKQEK